MRRTLIPAESLGRQDPWHAEQHDDGRAYENIPQEPPPFTTSEHALIIGQPGQLRQPDGSSFRFINYSNLPNHWLFQATRNSALQSSDLLSSSAS
jgi:hypothetical protein